MYWRANNIFSYYIMNNVIETKDFENLEIHNQENRLDGDRDGDGIPDKFQLKSCIGGQSDIRCIKLIVQIVLTGAVCGVSLAKLYDDDLSCEAGQTYMSLLSIMIGYWIKAVTD